MLYRLSGAGKTEIALQFAQKFRQKYLGVFWLSGSEIGTISNGFQSIAKKIGVYDAHDPEVTLQGTLSWLESHEQSLLIVDNLNAIPESEPLERLFVPHVSGIYGGHIIITSNNRQIAEKWHKIEVGPMTFEEGRELITSIIRRDHLHNYSDVERLIIALEKRTEVEDLLNELDGLALAVEFAAVHMSKHHRTPSQYRELFNKERKYQLGRLSTRRFEGKGGQSVISTWTLCYGNIEEVDPLASQLLLLLSLLDNEAVPLDLLNQALTRQQHWDKFGQFKNVSKADQWIPHTLKELFESESRLLDAIGILLD
jgi:hypothetical protein